MKSTAGARGSAGAAHGAAVLAALLFPAFTAWCYIQGWRWEVPFSFAGVVQFLGFSLLMAVLILALAMLVKVIATTNKVGPVVGFIAAFVVIFLLVLLGTFWLFQIRWFGPLVWDALFSPAVRSVWIYAAPLVAGAVYAVLVTVVFGVRAKKGG